MSLDPTPSDAELLRLHAARTSPPARAVATRAAPIALGPESPLLPGGRRSPRAKGAASPAPGARPRDLEHAEQAALITWRDEQPEDSPVRTLYAIPNGGGRSEREGAKLKAEGVLAGMLDLCLPVPRGGYGALYLEFKAEEGGKLGVAQQRRIRELRRWGNRVEVVFTAEAAKAVIRDYLGLLAEPGIP